MTETTLRESRRFSRPLILILVIRFGPIEEAFQRIEVALRRTWAVIKLRAAKLAPGFLDDVGRQLLEPLAGPHRIDLNLRGALEIIEPVIGVGDARTERSDAVIGHEQHGLVADDLSETLTFGRVEGRATVIAVIGDRVHQAH